MIDPVHTFLSSPVRKQLLMVKRHQKLVVLDKSRVGFFTRLLAKLGLGHASLKNISLHLKSHPEQLDSGTKARFNRYLKSYNQKTLLFWKKAPYLKLKASAHPKDSPTIDFRAEDLYLKCVKQFKNKDIHSLTKTVRGLRKAVQLLDPKDKKGNKGLFNDILKLKKEIKENVTNDALKVHLTKLQTTVLKIHFAKRLSHLDDQLVLLENKFNAAEDEWQEVDFIASQLKRWRKKINQGKLISIPKWYHCTKSPAVVSKIVVSSILYQHKGAYPGAFVANYPATGFGSFGLAMSEYIEKTATINGKFLPKRSNISSTINYGVQDPANSSTQGQSQLWLGFQRRRGIPIKHHKKATDLLKYYKDTTLFSIFYDKNRSLNDIQAIKAIAEKHKIQAINLDEQNALRLLLDSTFTLSLPADWKGKIKQF